MHRARKVEPRQGVAVLGPVRLLPQGMLVFGDGLLQLLPLQMLNCAAAMKLGIQNEFDARRRLLSVDETRRLRSPIKLTRGQFLAKSLKVPDIHVARSRSGCELQAIGAEPQPGNGLR